MSNLRLIYDNATDRATSISASTTSGALVAAYMQTDMKGQVHRSTGTRDRKSTRLNSSHRL